MKKYIIMLLLGVCSTLYTCGQIIHITVIDSVTGQPIPGTKLLLPSKKIKFTGPLGDIMFPCEKGLLYVDAPGYHADSLRLHCKNVTLSIRLCPDEIHLDAYQVKGAIDTDHGIEASRIPKSEIESNRFKTAGDMLTHIPGVALIRLGNGITKPVIRGLTGSRLITVYDGFRQEGQQWGLDHGIETDPSSIGNLKMIKGAGSLLYGTEGCGVILMQPPAYRPVKGFEGNTYISFAGNNKEMGLAQNYFFTGEKLYIRMMGSMRYAGDGKTPEYILSNTGLRNFNFQGSVKIGTSFNFHEFSWSSLYQKLGILRASHIDNLTALKMVIAAERPFIIKPFTFQIGNPHQQVIQNQFNYRRKKIGAKGWIQTFSQSIQYHIRHEYDVYNPIFKMGATPNFSTFLITSFSDYKIEKNLQNEVSLIVGLQNIFQHNMTGGRRYLIPEFNSNKTGIYVLLSKSYHRLELSMGGRADLFVSGITKIRFNNYATTQRNFAGLSGYLSLMYKYSQKHIISIHSGTGWRNPHVSELYSSGFHGATGNFEEGNAQLIKEQSYAQEVTYKSHFKNIAVELNIFFQHFDHFIYIRPTGNAITTINGSFPEMIYRQDPTQIWGIEGQMVWQMKSGQSLSLVYNYLKSKNMNTGYAIWLMPPPRFFLIYKRELKKGWNGQLEMQAVSYQKYIQPGTDFADPPPAYTLFSVSLNGPFKIKNKKWEVSLTISNLLNSKYRDYLSRYRYFANETGRDIRLIIHIPYHPAIKHIHN